MALQHEAYKDINVFQTLPGLHSTGRRNLPLYSNQIRVPYSKHLLLPPLKPSARDRNYQQSQARIMNELGPVRGKMVGLYQKLHPRRHWLHNDEAIPEENGGFMLYNKYNWKPLGAVSRTDFLSSDQRSKGRFENTPASAICPRPMMSKTKLKPQTMAFRSNAVSTPIPGVNTPLPSPNNSVSESKISFPEIPVRYWSGKTATKAEYCVCVHQPVRARTYDEDAQLSICRLFNTEHAPPSEGTGCTFTIKSLSMLFNCDKEAAPPPFGISSNELDNLKKVEMCAFKESSCYHCNKPNRWPSDENVAGDTHRLPPSPFPDGCSSHTAQNLLCDENVRNNGKLIDTKKTTNSDREEENVRSHGDYGDNTTSNRNSRSVAEHQINEKCATGNSQAVPIKSHFKRKHGLHKSKSISFLDSRENQSRHTLLQLVAQRQNRNESISAISNIDYIHRNRQIPSREQTNNTFQREKFLLRPRSHSARKPDAAKHVDLVQNTQMLKDIREGKFSFRLPDTNHRGSDVLPPNRVSSAKKCVIIPTTDHETRSETSENHAYEDSGGRLPDKPYVTNGTVEANNPDDEFKVCQEICEGNDLTTRDNPAEAGNKVKVISENGRGDCVSNTQKEVDIACDSNIVSMSGALRHSPSPVQNVGQLHESRADYTKMDTYRAQKPAEINLQLDQALTLRQLIPLPKACSTRPKSRERNDENQQRLKLSSETRPFLNRWKKEESVYIPHETADPPICETGSQSISFDKSAFDFKFSLMPQGGRNMKLARVKLAHIDIQFDDASVTPRQGHFVFPSTRVNGNGVDDNIEEDPPRLEITKYGPPVRSPSQNGENYIQVSHSSDKQQLSKAVLSSPRKYFSIFDQRNEQLENNGLAVYGTQVKLKNCYTGAERLKYYDYIADDGRYKNITHFHDNVAYCDGQKSHYLPENGLFQYVEPKHSACRPIAVSPESVPFNSPRVVSPEGVPFNSPDPDTIVIRSRMKFKNDEPKYSGTNLVSPEDVLYDSPNSDADTSSPFKFKGAVSSGHFVRGIVNEMTRDTAAQNMPQGVDTPVIFIPSVALPSHDNCKGSNWTAENTCERPEENTLCKENEEKASSKPVVIVTGQSVLRSNPENCIYSGVNENVDTNLSDLNGKAQNSQTGEMQFYDRADQLQSPAPSGDLMFSSDTEGEETCEGRLETDVGCGRQLSHVIHIGNDVDSADDTEQLTTDKKAVRFHRAKNTKSFRFMPRPNWPGLSINTLELTSKSSQQKCLDMLGIKTWSAHTSSRANLETLMLRRPTSFNPRVRKIIKEETGRMYVRGQRMYPPPPGRSDKTKQQGMPGCPVSAKSESSVMPYHYQFGICHQCKEKSEEARQ